MVNEFAVFFGLRSYSLPFFIVLEGLPVCGGGFTAGVLEDVDERVGACRFVGGRPVGDGAHVMPGENLVGVIAEAREEGVELAFGGVVDAEFVDGAGRRGLSRCWADESFG